MTVTEQGRATCGRPNCSVRCFPSGIHCVKLKLAAATAPVGGSGASQPHSEPTSVERKNESHWRNQVVLHKKNCKTLSKELRETHEKLAKTVAETDVMAAENAVKRFIKNQKDNSKTRKGTVQRNQGKGKENRKNATKPIERENCLLVSNI